MGRGAGCVRYTPCAFVNADAILLSVHWEGIADILTAAGAPARSLAGKPLIDPTNAVEHGIGAGDHRLALRDLGGVPAVLGGLDRARQLEEAAGLVVSLAFAGVNPQSAIPAVPSSGADETTPQP
jgi:8-hydroxy-5-deazaflavin:NADPH oxidoreductase